MFKRSTTLLGTVGLLGSLVTLPACDTEDGDGDTGSDELIDLASDPLDDDAQLGEAGAFAPEIDEFEAAIQHARGLPLSGVHFISEQDMLAAVPDLELDGLTDDDVEVHRRLFEQIDMQALAKPLTKKIVADRMSDRLDDAYRAILAIAPDPETRQNRVATKPVERETLAWDVQADLMDDAEGATPFWATKASEGQGYAASASSWLGDVSNCFFVNSDKAFWPPGAHTAGEVSEYRHTVDTNYGSPGCENTSLVDFWMPRADGDNAWPLQWNWAWIHAANRGPTYDQFLCERTTMNMAFLRYTMHVWRYYADGNASYGRTNQGEWSHGRCAFGYPEKYHTGTGPYLGNGTAGTRVATQLYSRFYIPGIGWIVIARTPHMTYFQTFWECCG